MIRNYINSAFRYFLRNKTFTIVNVLGLAVGIASAVLIYLYVNDELSFDKFHEKKDNIFLVYIDGKDGNKEWKEGSTVPPMAEAMKEEFPEIENAVRVCNWKEEKIVNYSENQFAEKNIIAADSSFFEFFTFPLLQGDPRTALAKPQTIVISKSTARKYFDDEDPLGKTLTFVNETWRENSYEVTGVMKDIPYHSHIHFDMVYSILSLDAAHNKNQWMNNTFSTYILLNKNSTPHNLESKFSLFVDKYIGPFMEKTMGVSIEEFRASGKRYDFKLLPLTETYLSTIAFEDKVGMKQFIYFISIIGFIILIIACVNYMNLSTTMSIDRAKEVGIRKTGGSSQSQLRWQFLSESVLLSLMALILGMILVESLLPFLNSFTGKQIRINYFQNPFVIPGLLLFGCILGIISGIYPAFVISAYKPSVVLTARSGKNSQGHFLRNGLTVFQFSICIIILVCTIVVHRQLSFMQHTDVGFDREQILAVPRAYALDKNHETFKQEMLNNPFIGKMSYMATLPGRHFNGMGNHLEGKPSSEWLTMKPWWGDCDLIETLGLNIIRGRNYSSKIPGDKYGIIINEAAIEKFGIIPPVLGQRFDNCQWPADEKKTYTIIGVVEDFQYETFHQNIEAACIMNIQDVEWYAGYAVMKVKQENMQETINYVKSKWDTFSNGYPFEYFFLDEDYNQMFNKEIKTKTIYSIFSIISIFITCMGLLALSAYTTQKKTKEIGIRKTHGANVSQIMLLLSGNFFKWIVISFALACPVSLFIMRRWLDNFAIRINIDWWIFVFAGFAACIMALLTVSWNSWLAAAKNPVEALRYE